MGGCKRTCGNTKKRLNHIYNGMKARCYKQNCNGFERYGGIGITVCEEWFNNDIVTINNVRGTKGWFAFKKWALNNGYREGLTLDRIDNSKGYCPDNCRWVTKKEQANNRRSNHFITYKGKTQTIAQWCDELGLNSCRVRSRLTTYHWSIEKAFEVKDKANEKNITYKNKTQNLKDWAMELGIDADTLCKRLKKYKWTVERAFETKVRKNTKKVTYKGKTQSIKEWANELNICYTTLTSRLRNPRFNIEEAFLGA